MKKKKPSDVAAPPGIQKGLITMSNTILSRFPREVKKMDNDQDRFFIAILATMFIAIIAAVIYLTRIDNEPLPELKSKPIETAEKEVIYEEVSEIVAKKQPSEPVLSDEEIMARVVMAEAGNQELLGKVAVAAVILNRCDMWGLTVETVVSQPNQFAYPYEGEVSEECYRAVEIALENRDLFDLTMIYFRNKHYHAFGTPYMQIDDHYFSLSEK